ncbi:hypothetical protein DID76_01940 [Candidatus Marinamargulisbacteria bacterium SCGC AG-414-C22]|nr:hypothetical protein DID76_01940 [Candidatus Marinamargulisbacteria bacterium SCGC AG-414-C22]
MKIKTKITFIQMIYTIVLLVGSFLVFYAISSVIQIKNTNKLSDSVADQISNIVIEKTIDYLLPAQIIAESAAQLAESNIIKTQNLDHIEDYLSNLLKPYPQLSNIYFADPAGNFVMISRKQNNRFEKRRQLNTNQEVKIQQVDSDYRVLQTKTVPSTYDARTRPWYIGAMEEHSLFWTNMYMYHATKTPGITASYPIYDKKKTLLGIFGVDIELQNISTFLTQQQVEKDVIVMILNQDKKIVALPKKVTFNSLPDGSIEPVSLAEVDNNIVQEVDKLTDIMKKNQFNLDFDNKKYLITRVPFPESFGKQWQVLMIFPQQATLKQSESMASQWWWVIALLLSVGLILGAFLSKWINITLLKKQIDETITIQKLKQSTEKKHEKTPLL